MDAAPPLDLSPGDFRRLLDFVLCGDDLDQFCCLYFPQIFENFASGMTTTARQTEILRRVAKSDIVQFLNEYAPQRLSEGLTRIRRKNSESISGHRQQLQLLQERRQLIEKEIQTILLTLRAGEQLIPGDTLAGERYTLMDIIGFGAASTVWRSQDRESGRQVAVRVLQKNHMRDKNRVAQFYDNAWLMGDLRHPNIIRVIQEPTNETGILYTVLEYMNTGNLAKEIRANKLDRNAIRNILLAIGDALMYCHSNRIYHLALKPANVLLNSAGRICITDFNHCRLSQADDDTEHGSFDVSFFSAPEVQRNQDKVDSKADAYSYALIIIYALAGPGFRQSLEDNPDHLLSSLACPSTLRSAIRLSIERKPHDRVADIRTLYEGVRLLS